MTTLIHLLQQIAAINNDEFAYRIDVKTRGTRLVFTFECFETADRHAFLEGHGTTFDECVNDALSGVDASCKAWGYLQP